MTTNHLLPLDLTAIASDQSEILYPQTDKDILFTSYIFTKKANKKPHLNNHEISFAFSNVSRWGTWPRRKSALNDAVHLEIQ